jgi:hypothetical protein
MTPARADDFGSVEVSSNFIQAAKIPFCLQPANDAAKFYPFCEVAGLHYFLFFNS